MPTEKKQLTVKPEFSEFSQAVDEYTARLPIAIREQFRQALFSEYEEKYDKVEELCNEIITEHPDNTETLALLGRAQLSQQKNEEAEKTFRDLLEKEPDRHYERIEHGLSLHALGKYHEALRELQKADPDKAYHPFYYSILGNCYEKTGNRQKARDAYRAEITLWEQTGETASPDILDGCFCNLIYLDAALYRKELLDDLDLYRRFMAETEMTPEMKNHLTSNIAYWSTLLTIPVFRDPFVKFVKDVEQEGYLLDSPGYSIIDSAYRAEESYRYHEDKNVDAFMESFLSAESGDQDGDGSDSARAVQLAHEWYMSKCVEEYSQMLLYVAEQYPYSYARTVTFLEQLQTSGPGKMRESILDRLQEEKIVKAERDTVAAELDKAYKNVRSARKQPVYVAEGSVTYKRSTKKIMPNDPCPCGSGKKFKKCHGR
ncbi:MAG: tetratricopeptide repeat protein [Eubacteriales bacterium]|nr:tetratricopeptide repeat protein [Eubacteriales bacterium]